MDGTIIVGQASKAGETKNMNHHKLTKKLEAGESTMHHSSAGIAATGKVISVDAEKRTVKLKHDPIKALNWPVMIMLFNVDNGIDLSGYKEGDAVNFTLKPHGKEDYIISGMKKN
jgi:Cu/Ag efflux protein CusF